MKYLVSLIVWTLFLVTSPVLFLIGLVVFAVTAPFDPDRNILHAYICRVTYAYLHVNPGWDLRIEGRERIPPGPCVLVANHQSMVDVVVVLGLFRPFKFVSKASLFSLPIVGWMMSLAKYVRLVRGSPRSTQRMMADCRRWLDRGVPVLIFPEGTYAEDHHLLPFKRGAFSLAVEKQVPIVPVIIEGTPSLIVGDGPWMSPRARIRVTVDPPIRPETFDGDDDLELAERTRALFAQRLGRPRV